VATSSAVVLNENAGMADIDCQDLVLRGLVEGDLERVDDCLWFVPFYRKPQMNNT
jgi:hypothetical protein